MEYSKREYLFGFARIADEILDLDNPTLEFYIDGEWYTLIYDRCYHDDNGLMPNDPLYDSFNVLVFKSPYFDEEYKINYQDMPLAIRKGDDFILNPQEEQIFRYHQLDNKNVVRLQFNENGPIIDTRNGKFMTFIPEVDIDIKVKTLNKELNQLFKKCINHYQNDINLMPEEDQNKIKDMILTLKNRLNELNDGSFIISDELNLSSKLNQEENEFKFNGEDNYYLEHYDAENLLNKGANLYTKGDYKKAFPYYLVSAIMGEPQAISNLGYCYMYGRDVEKNFDLALKLFQLAADKGVVDAHYKLATIYKYNKDYKNDYLCKTHLISCMQNIVDNNDYPRFASICLFIAKEKIDGVFDKDLCGAYLLLKLALKGYESDLKEGFTPHQKQYEETLCLLKSDIFKDVKKYYKKDDERCYVLSCLPLDIDEFNKPYYFKKGDEVGLLTSGSIDEDNSFSSGTIGKVLAIQQNTLYIKLLNDNGKICKIYIEKSKVIKINHDK